MILATAVFMVGLGLHLRFQSEVMDPIPIGSPEAKSVLEPVFVADHKIAVGEDQQASYLVQAQSHVQARKLVEEVGGRITNDLAIIRTVSALLTEAQLKALKARNPDVRVWEDRELSTSWSRRNPRRGRQSSRPTKTPTNFPTLVEADDLHDLGFDGQGVTVAVVDTGLWEGSDALTRTADSQKRVLINCDLLHDDDDDDGDDDRVCLNDDDDDDDDEETAGDASGHGTHIVSVIMSSDRGPTHYHGVAPSAKVVSVRAFDEYGRGSYSDVIRAIDFIFQNREKLGVRVLNLSLSAPPNSHYWDDPLNQAVMASWEAGIVVVAAAGNRGP